MLDELHRLAVAGIIAISATQAVRALLDEPGPQIVDPDDVAGLRLDLAHIGGADVFKLADVEVILPAIPEIVLAEPEAKFPAYTDLRYRLAAPARFWQYLNGELAAFGLPLPPVPEEPPGPPKSVSKKQLIDFLLEYQERPTEPKFHEAANHRFRPPDYLPISRNAVREATRDEERVAVRFGPTKPRAGRPPKK